MEVAILTIPKSNCLRPGFAYFPRKRNGLEEVKLALVLVMEAAWCTAGVSDFLRETIEYAAGSHPDNKTFNASASDDGDDGRQLWFRAEKHDAARIGDECMYAYTPMRWRRLNKASLLGKV